MPLDDARWPEVSEQIRKMDRVINLLDREDRWCKQQLRSYDGGHCMLGALMAVGESSITPLGIAVLGAIKQVTGRDYLRIEFFNDHPLTTYAQVRQVLDAARTHLLIGEATIKAPEPGSFVRRMLATVMP